jgi:hypothetical protein
MAAALEKSMRRWRLSMQHRGLPRRLSDSAIFVRSPAIQSALERSSDTFPAVRLRAVERALAHQSRTDREIIRRLWDVLDDSHLNNALGLPQHPASRSDHILHTGECEPLSAGRQVSYEIVIDCIVTGNWSDLQVRN